MLLFHNLIFFSSKCSEHPWICDNGVATDQTRDPTVSHLNKLSATNKLKKLARLVCAWWISFYSFHHHGEALGRLLKTFGVAFFITYLLLSAMDRYYDMIKVSLVFVPAMKG